MSNLPARFEGFSFNDIRFVLRQSSHNDGGAPSTRHRALQLRSMGIVAGLCYANHVTAGATEYS